MPRFSQQLLDCVFFLFRTPEDASAGANPIGTGFLVGVPSRWAGRHHMYAVTNWHVALRDAGSVIGLNRLAGGIDAIDTLPTDWFWDPKGDDFAVIPISVNPRRHRLAQITTTVFATEKDVSDFHIGIGDDTFMLGLLVDHTATAKTLPKARFGNISMMPDASAPIVQATGYAGADFVMDMHSRDGFSGSPVFMYRTPGADLTFVNASAKDLQNPTKFLNSPPVFCFIGIHWGQFPENWKIERTNVPIGTPNERVRGLSGLTCVIPSWRLLAYLNRPNFVAMRKRAEDAERAANPSLDAQPVAEGAMSVSLPSGNNANQQ